MKKEILDMLMKNPDKYISGEEISKKFSVSRTAVWKAIASMKSKGYEIESISGKGYRLLKSSSKLNENELLLKIKSDKHSYNFICLDKVDSTNTYLKKQANEGIGEWTIVFAEEQDGGRGRLGKNWEADFGKNILMSILLKPNILPYQAPKITQVAAASTYLALKKLFDIDIKIKWPNDIVYEGKKICGILTEMTGELNAISYIILGIGINVNNENFSPEVGRIATSLKIMLEKEEEIDRKDIIEAFLDEFERLYYEFVNNNSVEETLDICRKHSAVINEKVNVIMGGNARVVKVIDINENGELLVENELGKMETIISGEVSIRKENGYI